MDLVQNPYYKFYKILLMCFGLWPYQPKIIKTIIFILFYALSSSVIFALILGLTEKWSTRRLVIIKNIAVIVYFVGILIGYTSLFINESKLKHLHEIFMSQWSLAKDKVEAQTLLSCTRKGISIVIMQIIYFVPAYLVVMVYEGVPPLQHPFTKEHYEKYFPYYYSGMIVNESFHLCLTALHLGVGLLVANSCYFTIAAVYIVCSNHACGIYKISRLKNIIKQNNEPSETELKPMQFLADEKVISNLIEVVKKHEEAA